MYPIIWLVRVCCIAILNKTSSLSLRIKNTSLCQSKTIYIWVFFITNSHLKNYLLNILMLLILIQVHYALCYHSTLELLGTYCYLACTRFFTYSIAQHTLVTQDKISFILLNTLCLILCLDSSVQLTLLGFYLLFSLNGGSVIVMTNQYAR